MASQQETLPDFLKKCLQHLFQFFFLYNFFLSQNVLKHMLKNLIIGSLWRWELCRSLSRTEPKSIPRTLKIIKSWNPLKWLTLYINDWRSSNRVANCGIFLNPQYTLKYRNWRVELRAKRESICESQELLCF